MCIISMSLFFHLDMSECEAVVPGCCCDCVALIAVSVIAAVCTCIVVVVCLVVLLWRCVNWESCTYKSGTGKCQYLFLMDIQSLWSSVLAYLHLVVCPKLLLLFTYGYTVCVMFTPCTTCNWFLHPDMSIYICPDPYDWCIVIFYH